jgi:hypothetical protein
MPSRILLLVLDTEALWHHAPRSIPISSSLRTHQLAEMADEILEKVRDVAEGQIDFEGQRLAERWSTVLLAVVGVSSLLPMIQIACFLVLKTNFVSGYCVRRGLPLAGYKTGTVYRAGRDGRCLPRHRAAVALLQPEPG